MNQLFKNKYRIDSTRLKGWDYSSNGYYFITICAYQRKCLFGEIINEEMKLNLFGKIIKQEWLKSEKIRKEIRLDSFIIMPNHIHGIVIIDKPIEMPIIEQAANHKPISRLVETHGCASYNNENQGTKTHCHVSLQKPSNEKPTLSRLPKSLPSFISGFKSVTTKKINTYRKIQKGCVWQPSFYDSIIKNEKELNTIRQYIHINPVKWSINRNNPKNLN